MGLLNLSPVPFCTAMQRIWCAQPDQAAALAQGVVELLAMP
jgi:hypothetical protein